MRINHIKFDLGTDLFSVEIIRHNNNGVASSCLEVRVSHGLESGTKFYDNEMLPQLASRLAGLDCGFRNVKHDTTKWSKFLKQFDI